MSRKPRFKPEITRVKLNPEQAVLSCTCHGLGAHWTSGSPTKSLFANNQYVCDPGSRSMGTVDVSGCHWSGQFGYFAFAVTAGSSLES